MATTTQLVLETIVKGTETAVKDMSKLQKSIEKNADAIKDFAKSASKVAAVAGLALGAFVAKTTSGFADLGEQIDLFTKKSGVSAEAASALKFSLESMGMSMEVAEVGIKKMQDTLVNMGSNAKLAAKNLDPLHLKLSEIKGLRPEEQMFKLGNAIAQIKDPAERTAAAINIFGKAGTDLIPLFGDGKMTLDQFVESARKMGVVMSADGLKNALALDQAMDNLKGTMGGLAIQIGGALAPSITKLIDEQIKPALTAITGWIQKNPELTLKIIEWTGVILGATAALWPLITVLGVFGTVLSFIAANPIVLLIAALVGLGVAIALLVVNWDAVVIKIKAIWTSFKAWMDIKLTEFKTAWQNLFPAIGGLIEAGKSFIVNAFKGIWESIKADALAVFDFIMEKLRILIDALKDPIGTAFPGVKASIQQAGGATGRALRRQGGGPVGAGSPTLVGEKGPEMFVPNMGGKIVPNDRLGGGITFNFSGVFGSDAAEEIGDMIVRRLAGHIAI